MDKNRKFNGLLKRILPTMLSTTLGISTPISMSAESTTKKPANSQLEDKISSIEYKLFEASSLVSTQNAPGMVKMTARQIGVSLPNGKVEVLFTDDPNSAALPDYCLVVTYKNQPKLMPHEEFLDAGLDGLKQSKNVNSDSDLLIVEDEYNTREINGVLEEKLSSLSNEELKEKNSMLFRYLTQVLAYSSNSAGALEAIKPNDLGIQNPREIPQAGFLAWSELSSGFEVSSLDVIFRDKLFDRIELIRIDPNKYKFSVHNDPSLRTIEKWREDLGALAVINTSFYHRDPYGFPLTPIISNGATKGPKSWKTLDKRCGAFLAEPVDSNVPLVKIVEFENNSVVNMQQLGYKEGILNYPCLLHPDKNLVGQYLLRPQRRANRTFICLDRESKVILGTTENGFFDLGRLGRFLDSVTELNLEYALNMDGGPPACMTIKAGDFEYTHYGSWEVNEGSSSNNGDFKYGWTNRNALEWKIPNVLAVKKR